MDLLKIINEAAEANYTICYPIEEFTMEDIVDLSILAQKNGVEIFVNSQFDHGIEKVYQGTLLEFRKRNDGE